MEPGNAARVREVSVRDLDIELHEPFGIATGAQARAENLLVRVVLESGVEGFGEAAPFPAVNGETREQTRAAIDLAGPGLVGWDVRGFRGTAVRLASQIPDAPSARCALETAMFDALGRALTVPLWKYFGDAGATVETDWTITTGSARAAGEAASRIASARFHTIKLKVGGVPLEEDAERVRAVVAAAPSSRLLLDGNGALGTPDRAVALVDAARREGADVVLFEQPLGKYDWEGMRELTARRVCPVAADETAQTVSDVLRIARERTADVVNVKIMKSGVVEALDMIAAARSSGLGLMIGGMVESTLAMSMSAAIAAGQGGFSFVDLDTPMFMVDVPMVGGYVQRGPVLDLSGVLAGHGVVPRPARS